MTCDRSVFEEGNNYHWVLEKSVCAIEIEYSTSNSLSYRERNCAPKPWKLKKRHGPKNLPKPPSAPNVWVKGEDLHRLNAWQEDHNINIIVLHFFNHEAFAVLLSDVYDAAQHIYNLARTSKPRAHKYMQEHGIYCTEHDYVNYLSEGSSQTKDVIVVAPFASKKAANISDVNITSYVVEQHAKYSAKVLFVFLCTIMAAIISRR